ncbi:enoyl-CoA hydratase [Sansalvadorimonas verongulae]|uniref:enoyl-CoA hydratase n=1 Tax=Sansalvadorimonas verongulae TaxID=2172824 RepID=UPI0012BBDAE9|nr:enoyl-CoA hydratase [Sansalvadorimonas verongulae]MTI15516.1 enoyl-CoA hydratase [Sansalvadorimonas verongulae]
MTDQIISERRGSTLVLSINRPERKNALSHAMYSALAEEVEQATRESPIRAIVLTGTQDCFTAGNDLGDFLDTPPIGDDAPVLRFMLALLECPKPVITALNGVAVGIGTTLLLHSDLVYAGPNTKLQTPFTRLGLCPEFASSLVLPKLIGHQKAFEMLILGDVVNAEQAQALGLVNEVSEKYLELALEKARQIAALPPASVRLGKKLMHSETRKQVIKQIKLEMTWFAERLNSGEAREAFAAFLEKRQPDFSQFE